MSYILRTTICSVYFNRVASFYSIYLGKVFRHCLLCWLDRWVCQLTVRPRKELSKTWGLCWAKLCGRVRDTNDKFRRLPFVRESILLLLFFSWNISQRNKYMARSSYISSFVHKFIQPVMLSCAAIPFKIYQLLIREEVTRHRYQRVGELLHEF